jgi:hypothetical protein
LECRLSGLEDKIDIKEKSWSDKEKNNEEIKTEDLKTL